MTNDRGDNRCGVAIPHGVANGRGNQLCHLHCRVPVEARRRAKIAAIKSGLPFRIYVAQLLLQAKPLSMAQSGTTDTGKSVPGEASTSAESAMERVSDGDPGTVSGDNGDDAEEEAAMAAEQDGDSEERS